MSEEDEVLIGELSYSPMFRRFVELIVKPRIEETRSSLLRNTALPEAERVGQQRFLLKTEEMLGAVYEVTEGGTPPPWVENLFR